MADFSNLIDLANLAKTVGKQAIFVAPERCLAVRHRRSSCHKCQDVCAFDAIEIGPNKVELDAGQCAGCTACSTICPTEALVPLDPPDQMLKHQALTLLAKAEEVGLNAGTVCFACARMAARQEVDEHSFVEVPCLCRVHESLLLQLVAAGAQEIVLVDAQCRSCKFGSSQEVADQVKENAQQLLKAQGNKAIVRQASSFPEGLGAFEQVALSATRRAFFSESASQGKDAASKTARFFLRKEAKKDTTVATMLDMFGVSVEEQSKVAEPQRNTELIDAFFEIGSPCQEQIKTRFFGTLDIDSVKCSLCGICAVVCPTNALARGKNSNGQDGSFLEFWAADCLQCHLCEDVCFRKCLTVSDEVPLDLLFDFEPQKLK